MLGDGEATVEELNGCVHGSSLWHTELFGRLEFRTGNRDMYLTAGKCYSLACLRSLGLR